MEERIKELEIQINKIEERNKKVEADKAWETSWHRRWSILVLTYTLVVVFFLIANLPNPFVNAIVPTLGFLLSTLSINLLKEIRVQRFYEKN